MPPVGEGPRDDLGLPRTNAPLVSIVIVGRDLSATRRTLRSIARHRPRAPVELILLDDAPDASGLHGLAAVAGLRYHANARPLGLARACNRAAHLARGAYLHLLAEGSEVTEGWLDILLDAFARPGCGIAGSTLLRLAARPGGAERADRCSPASLLVGADLFALLGGFDAQDAPPSDAVAGLEARARAAGREVVVQPLSWVVAPAGEGDAAAAVRPGRGRVLVVDHYLPEPDHDAGSRSMWCMLRQLVGMGLDVTFWPDNLHYHGPYAQPLEAIGIQVVHGRHLQGRFDRWIAAVGGSIDYALLSRPYISDKYIEGLRRHSAARLIYWGVDLHYRRMLQQGEVQDDPGILKQAEAMKALELKQWRETDAILYPSDSETAEVLATMPAARAYTLPLYYYDTLDDEVVGPPDGRADILFVAGFRHAPNVDAAAWFVASVLPAVRRSVPGVRLTLAGADPTPEVLALATDGVAVTGHLSDAALAQRYRAARVAVVPLRFGGGVKGKVLEALHSGVPLVTTSVGLQGLPGLAGIVATTDEAEAFAAHVVRLLADDAAWLRAAADGRAYVRANFPPERMRGVLERAIAAPPGA
jgi:glycosyltransferase involved in cell wall biosynthesis